MLRARRPSLALLAAAAASAVLAAPASAQILINEVDADSPGTDVAEFVELYDGGAGNTSLSGYVLVLYNGSNDLSYQAFDLDGQSTDANGYFVLCGDAANVAGCDLDVTPNSDLVQNGQDAVALYAADAADFPSNTPVTVVDLVDALVYDTSDADDAGLLVLLNAGQPQVDENANTLGATESNQRCPNGTGGARNTSSYDQYAPTPGAANTCGVTSPTLSIADAGIIEGDGGTSNLVFTVTVSPAAAGTVTFDIATSDGTATDADNDYEPQALLDQEIASPNTTYQFTVVINGDTAVEATETFTVTVTDVSGADSGDLTATGTITNDEVTLTAIHAIQGAGSSSPLAGQAVTTRGIVTGVKGDGFFLQAKDADADADPATSEGILVYTNSAPPAAAVVGAEVQVSGT
ncbi:MAG: lamin tail domain-containing protein, partial [Thermoanaerobaculia bacterium]|nr:lamin tail domain-containing protein [Thermoanaerobaculia bacterium]